MNSEDQTRIRLVNLYYWAGLIIVFGLAVFTGVPVFWIAFWFLLFWALCSLLWLMNLAKNMEFVVTVYPRETARYGSVNLELRVINDSFLPLPYAEFQIENLDEEKFSSNYHNQGSSYAGQEGSRGQKRIKTPGKNDEKDEEKIEFDDNYPLGSWKVQYRLKCFRRGHHYLGPFRVKLYTLFGALAVDKIFSGSRSFVVYPRALPFSGRYNVESVEPHGARRNILSNPFSQFDYTESYDLRPFYPGDPFKLINWKVSARQGEIYVKRPDVTSQIKIVIGVEFSEAHYSSREEQDQVLEKVLSLAAHLLMNRYQVGLLTYDGRQHYLPPGRGEKQFNLIRKIFTDLKPGCRGSLLKHTVYNRWAARDRLIWVTPGLDQEYLNGLSYITQPGQKLSLMVTGEDYRLEYNNLLAHFYLWQLIFKNDRVTVKRVETSWL